jgi:prephenate dehydratase
MIMPNILFSGARGAFGELAARRRFGENADIAPVAGFDAVFSSVRQKKAAFGVVPIENSLAAAYTKTMTSC